MHVARLSGGLLPYGVKIRQIWSRHLPSSFISRWLCTKLGDLSHSIWQRRGKRGKEGGKKEEKILTHSLSFRRKPGTILRALWKRRGEAIA